MYFNYTKKKGLHYCQKKIPQSLWPARDEFQQDAKI
jgi:hypothetical protein